MNLEFYSEKKISNLSNVLPMAPVAAGGTELTTGLGSVTFGPEVASELWLFEFDFALV